MDLAQRNEIVMHGLSTNYMIARIAKPVRPTTIGAVKRNATKPEAIIKRIPSPPFICLVFRHASMQMIRPITGHQQRPTALSAHTMACRVHR